MSFLSGLKMKRAVGVLALIMLVGCLVGCKTITATPTPGVTQFYSQAALVLNDFSGILVQAQQIVTTVHAEGAMSDADYASAQTVFRSIGQQGENVVTLLKVGGSQAAVTAQINALISQVGTMPSAFGIKNPQSQQQFSALVLSMQNVLRASLTLVGTPSSIPAGQAVFTSGVSK